MLHTTQGNVRLASVSIRGQPSCVAPVMEPGSAYTCNASLASTQDQFAAAAMLVTFIADATPR